MKGSQTGEILLTVFVKNCLMTSPGLQVHIWTNFPLLYKLYERMKERNEVPPEEEILVAQGERDIKTIRLNAPLASTNPLADSFHNAEWSTASLTCLELIL
jgi:hypothetical protein